MGAFVRRFAAIVAIALSMALAAALGSAGHAPAAPLMPTPDPDQFYAAPADLAAHAPGDVLKFREKPWHVYFPTSRVYEVLFRSTDSEGKPIAANATYLLPQNHQPDGPLMSYQHIINALGTKCKVATKLYTSDPTNLILEMPGLNLVLSRGWSVVLPDHLGPRMAYGAAKLGGQITLDGIRAVKKIPELGVTHSKVGMGGYSGGGMATAWAAALAETYAPELDIVGSAYGGVPMNLTTMARALGDQPHIAFGLAAIALIGLEREYPDRLNVADQLNPYGHWLANWVINGCTNEAMFVGAYKSAGQMTDNKNFMADPGAWQVLNENSLEFYPGKPDAPVFEWHSPIDGLIPVDAIDHTLQRYCAAGVELFTMLTPTPDHLSAAPLGMFQALDWLEKKFQGQPTARTC
ncbi:lipase family protein [Aldersonia sp. NBC_00410]|uniref:lipase family protein n=1 Tax=Aldersonia sp. NBC_00410 TaxID=2975954 RepID=UPI00225BCA2D|nr:lipase family protein [Aldersonia sp. NBC_00410]MCX5046337.1 lipase family protein [Aldersonia sp. NBC_00410]